jgi:hypothetical protein
MATLADIRRVALSLPGASEGDYGGPRFQVGKKAFAHYWVRDDAWIFKLPHARQELLFEVRPETFRPFRAGAMVWSYVDVPALSKAEARLLATEAWSTIVPKKVSAPILAAQAR